MAWFFSFLIFFSDTGPEFEAISSGQLKGPSQRSEEIGELLRK